MPARRACTAAEARCLHDICTVVRGGRTNRARVNVVETHDGDVAGNFTGGTMQAVQHADGGHVVGANDSSGEFGEPEKLFGSLDAALHGVRAFDEMFGWDLKSHSDIALTKASRRAAAESICNGPPMKAIRRWPSTARCCTASRIPSP